VLNAACVRLPDLSGGWAAPWDGGVVFSDEFDGDNLLMPVSVFALGYCQNQRPTFAKGDGGRCCMVAND